jgi:hypothetical protein
MTNFNDPGSWLVLTAGLGGNNFRAAANRVVEDASRFKFVKKAIAVYEEDLFMVCPSTSSQYGQYLNPAHHGYGYFSWKSEIVMRGLTGYWGEYDGVIWIDAGCEVYASVLTSLRLKKWLRDSKLSGVHCFALNTPENIYTKRDVFELFPGLQSNDSSDQIQATWIIFHKSALAIAQEWFNKSQSGINSLDLSVSKQGDPSDFVQHRFDQSLLSLTLKSRGIQPSKIAPVAGKTGVLSKLRASTHPIWTSRNREGRTLIPSFVSFFKLRTNDKK